MGWGGMWEEEQGESGRYLGSEGGLEGCPGVGTGAQTTV